MVTNTEILDALWKKHIYGRTGNAVGIKALTDTRLTQMRNAEERKAKFGFRMGVTVLGIWAFNILVILPFVMLAK
jgi:hypothetical protein